MTLERAKTVHKMNNVLERAVIDAQSAEWASAPPRFAVARVIYSRLLGSSQAHASECSQTEQKLQQAASRNTDNLAEKLRAKLGG